MTNSQYWREREAEYIAAAKRCERIPEDAQKAAEARDMRACAADAARRAEEAEAEERAEAEALEQNANQNAQNAPESIIENKKGEFTMQNKIITTVEYELEVQRSNVTPGQFLAYVRARAKAKGLSVEMSARDFAADDGWNSSYDDATPDTKGTGCAAEINRGKPYDKQTYIRWYDGTVYNEIIEFDFDDEKTGHGYYYLVQKNAPEEAKDNNTRLYFESVKKRTAEQIERNNREVGKFRDKLECEYLTGYYREYLNTEIRIRERDNEMLNDKIAECDELIEELNQKIETPENMVKAIRSEVEKTKTRSAWDRGVKEYAVEMLDELGFSAEYGYADMSDFSNWTMLNRKLLNGAENWRQYSEGGSALCYDGQIAERLCAPWELRKTENGCKDPNPRETWIDVQSRALHQAAYMIRDAYREVREGRA